MSTLTLDRIRRMLANARQKIDAQGFPGGSYVCLVHPETFDTMCKADARGTWYAQHRQNRIAKRTGRAPKVVERTFTASTEQMLGVRILVDDGSR